MVSSGVVGITFKIAGENSGVRIQRYRRPSAGLIKKETPVLRQSDKTVHEHEGSPKLDSSSFIDIKFLKFHK
jgi:hypothetical protein